MHNPRIGFLLECIENAMTNASDAEKTLNSKGTKYEQCKENQQKSFGYENWLEKRTAGCYSLEMSSMKRLHLKVIEMLISFLHCRYRKCSFMREIGLNALVYTDMVLTQG